MSIVPDRAAPNSAATRDLLECVRRLASPETADGATADLRRAAASLHAALHAIIMALLRGPAPVKEATCAWVAACLNANSERGKLVPDDSVAASVGFGLNLHAVLLRVAAPFADPAPTGRAWGKVRAAYLADGAVSFDRDTRLAADEAATAEWTKTAGAARGPSPPPHHFVNFAFWATLKASMYGASAALAEMQTLGHRARHAASAARALGAQAAAAAGTPAGATHAAHAEEARAAASSMRLFAVVLAVAARDPGVAANAACFARLQAAWALRAAVGVAETADPPPPTVLPLPTPPPTAWTILPESLLTSLADVLTLAPPATFDGPAGAAAAADVARAAVVFIASPAHVRNPYVRSQLLGLLHGWLGAGAVSGDDDDGMSAQPAASPAAAALDGDALSRGHLVRSLLLLYADIESTSRDTSAAGEKYGGRLHITQVLARLWRAPPHREAWLAAASLEASGPDSLYGRFMHFLLQDATYLLDEAMAKLRVVSAAERARADTAAWASRADRDDVDAAASSAADMIPGALDLASAAVDLMRYSTVPAAGAAPWLGAAMVDRTAAALDYFLALLVGSSRSKLKVADPASLHWDPKGLLAALAGVYVNLWRASVGGGGGDATTTTTNPLAAAIAADDRSYGSTPGLFTEAASIVRALGLLPPADADSLDALAAAAATAAAVAASIDESDAPDEFVCGLLSTVMADPVRLPGSGTVVDRAAAERALVSAPIDPFTRTPLTRDQLVALPELRARIESWRASKGAGG